MGLLNKIKGILFEEVEEDEVVSTPKSEEKKPIAEKIEPQRKVEEPVEKSVPKVTAPVKETKTENLNERDLFKSDNISPFFDFDEEEFSNMSRVQKPKTTNVMEYERKKRVEKRYDMGNFSKIERTEVVEKKKFKPSPIISPVYGILNEDYKPEDIKSKTDNVVNTGLDFNSVRKKAFGEETLGEPEATYYEESVTVKVKENEEEKQQKVKTIDELLEDTSDVTIDVDEKNSVEDKNNKEATDEVADYERIDKDLEEVTAKRDANKTEMRKVEDDDTLENDLFDLIDSMYDNREEGDI
ncbi:MAG: hypothetical protein KIC76_05465 [Firmicutes bacterium]|nr:hypothetical protein [Bacillota bacterium]